MQVTFVHFNFESLAIEYLSASLRKTGHAVSLVFRLAPSSILVRRRRSMSFFNEIAAEVVAHKPDLVAFSAMSDYYPVMSEAAKAIKEVNGMIPIIFGGIHPTSVPESVIKEEYIDYVCVGDGEEAIVELATALATGSDTTRIQNIWSKKRGVIVKNPPRYLQGNLDSLPTPDKELFFRISREMVKDYTTFFTRGCRYSCSYCYNNVLKKIYVDRGTYYRRRSVDNLINELVGAKEQYGIRSVFFIDDIFCSDTSSLEDFALKYKRFVGLPFFCLAFPHAEITSEYNLRLLKEAGCIYISLGVQCLNAEVRNRILKRPGSNEDILTSLAVLRRSGIFTNVELMVGIPTQCKDDIIAFIRFFSEHRPDSIAVYWLRYYPGTEIAHLQHAVEDSSVSADIQSFSPFSEGGSTYNPGTAQLVNLLLLSNILSKGLVDFFLERNIYKFFHGNNLFLMRCNTVFGLLRRNMLFTRVGRALLLKNIMVSWKLRMTAYISEPGQGG